MSSSNLSLVKSDVYQSIMIKVDDCELPYVDEDRADDIRIQFFHTSYYNILICLSIIEELMKLYDREILNSKLVNLFKMYSNDRCIIKDIDMLRELLIYSKETYYNECDNYSKKIECGSLLHLVIITVNPVRFVSVIKNNLDIDKDFCILIEVNKNMSKLSLETLENYMKCKYDMGFYINMINKDKKISNSISRVKVVDY